MKHYFRKIWLKLKAFHQLGWKASFLFAVYQLQLRLGFFQFLTPSTSPQPGQWPLNLPNFKLNYQLSEDPKSLLIQQADQICQGHIPVFGDQTIPWNPRNNSPLRHWSKYKASFIDGKDIKYFWEPGRFSWATTLARAYFFTKDEKYSQAFWKYTQEFLLENPPNQGLQWISAQEVAIRLISLTFALSIFKDSQHTTPDLLATISGAIAEHAKRIPPSLAYARAQNNNHLLTEAAGLYTAGLLLPDHPQSKRWVRLGWKWINLGFQSQIEADGSYMQNSSNYHRLMLQTALWVNRLMAETKEKWPADIASRLTSAVNWQIALLDEKNGKVPNLGPNDGAYILPLTTLPYNDYRPVLQAASKSFLGKSAFPSGPWDEIKDWLSIQPENPPPVTPNTNILKVSGKDSWATLRAAEFKQRPGHADQLHLDLWWRGINIAMDAGTYLYNAPPPWQNALSGTEVHNTIMVNQTDQMSKAGRFLWLDWAQATILENSPQRIAAKHNGYRKFGIAHQRTVEYEGTNRLTITDTLSSASRHASPHPIRLHWLLPDWPWELEGETLRIQSSHGWVTLSIQCELPLSISLARAGELLMGEERAKPFQGWVSPTYGTKNPALSFSITTSVNFFPVNISSQFSFPPQP